MRCISTIVISYSEFRFNLQGASERKDERGETCEKRGTLDRQI